MFSENCRGTGTKEWESRCIETDKWLNYAIEVLDLIEYDSKTYACSGCLDSLFELALASPLRTLE
jgi:hypothetical protein